MKKITIVISLMFVSLSLFAGNMKYYYQYENRTALSVGVGYDYYSMNITEPGYSSFTLSGPTLNIKAETPIRSLAGISIFWDSAIMIPSLAYVDITSSNSYKLSDSQFLLSEIGESDDSASYFLMDNNIGVNMLGTINDSTFVYIGGGLDIMIGNASYKYTPISSTSEKYRYGYLGIGIFETVGMYFEFNDNLALNVGVSYTSDFLVYNYINSSEDSSSNKFEMIDAYGTSYLGKLMLTYNF
ncbi:MAG: hypothetical protein ACRQFF_09745 [Sphaerochaeta sp.]